MGAQWGETPGPRRPAPARGGLPRPAICLGRGNLPGLRFALAAATCPACDLPWPRQPALACDLPGQWHPAWPAICPAAAACLTRPAAPRLNFYATNGIISTN